VRSGPLIGGIALYNVAQNTLLTDRGYVVGNLVVTAAALAWARRTGIGWDELGLDPEDIPLGLATGAVVGTVAAGVTLAMRDSQLTRTLFDDDRLEGVGHREVRYRVLVRFPLGTALFEEVVFRGVLPAAFRDRPVWQRELIAAGTFAAWHIIPTTHTVGANRKARSLDPWRKTTAVLGGSLAAGLAGLGFSALRRWSSSLAAPWLAHTVVNGLTLALASSAWKQASGSARVRT
jgi:hypothetical protein